MPHQKILIFVNLYQHAKNDAVSLIYSGEMLDLKILQSEWLKAFWPISHEQHFSHIEDLHRNTITERLQGKLSDKKSDMHSLIRSSSTILKFRET